MPNCPALLISGFPTGTWIRSGGIDWAFHCPEVILILPLARCYELEQKLYKLCLIRTSSWRISRESWTKRCHTGTLYRTTICPDMHPHRLHPPILVDASADSWSRWRFDQYLSHDPDKIRAMLKDPALQIVVFDIFDTLLTRPL